MSETAHTHEQPAELSLVDRVMQDSRAAYEKLTAMRESRSDGYSGYLEHERPDSKALAEALGAFAAAHVDHLDELPQLPMPAEVEQALDDISRRLLKHGLEWAMYDQYERQQSAKIAALLNGKVIVATSLAYGHAVSDGTGTDSGYLENMVAVGEFMHADPDLGNIWIGGPCKAYRISLWQEEYDVATPRDGRIAVQSEIQVFESMEEARATVRKREALVFAAKASDGDNPNILIRRALALEPYITHEPGEQTGQN